MEAAKLQDRLAPATKQSAERPPPVKTNAALRIARDVRDEVTAKGPFPPGPTDISLGRTLRMARDPLPILLDAYRDYGPVFSMRVLHGLRVWALGPEANHQILVSNASNFLWRDGRLRRPDPAARRRPADDRRRLPPAGAADHAAGVPPRADRGRNRRDGRGGRPRARPLAAGRGRRPLPLGAQPRDAGRDASPARPRSRRRRHRRPRGRRVRARAVVLRHRFRAAASCAARARRGRA